MKRVVVESPFAGEILRNEIYAEFACHDCLVNHGESPYASHILYTRRYVLRDEIPEERKLGIEAGFAWRESAEQTNFYIDLGMSGGMKLGLEDAKEKHNPYDVRKLPDDLWLRFQHACAENGLPIPDR